MAEPRKPQDHKKKTEKKAPPEANFSFEHDGETYTFERETSDVLTPGLLRKNRHEDFSELVWLVLEKAAGDKVLEVIDNLPFKAYKSVFEDLLDHVEGTMGVGLGE